MTEYKLEITKKVDLEQDKVLTRIVLNNEAQRLLGLFKVNGDEPLPTVEGLDRYLTKNVLRNKISSDAVNYLFIKELIDNGSVELANSSVSEESIKRAFNQTLECAVELLAGSTTKVRITQEA
jgi:hypothetical protein